MDTPSRSRRAHGSSINPQQAATQTKRTKRRASPFPTRNPPCISGSMLRPCRCPIRCSSSRFWAAGQVNKMFASWPPHSPRATSCSTTHTSSPTNPFYNYKNAWNNTHPLQFSLRPSCRCAGVSAISASKSPWADRTTSSHLIRSARA